MGVFEHFFLWGCIPQELLGETLREASTASFRRSNATVTILVDRPFQLFLQNGKIGGAIGRGYDDFAVHDRGPFVRGRMIDVSVSAARALGMMRTGVILVSVD